MKKINFSPKVERVIVATKEIAQREWNKNLPAPLTAGEKCVVDRDQDNVSKGYVRVKRKNGKSVFSVAHFSNLKGIQFRS